MLRSPFFYLIPLLFLFSCKEKKTIDPNIKSSRKEALRLRDNADENYQKENFNRAFYDFNKSKLLFETIKDSANISYVLIQMATIQQVNGDYYGSKETVTEALPFAKKIKGHISCINNILGIADKELSLYNDAIFYYNESVKESESFEGKQAPLSNIAAVYIYQKKYNEAIILLESILDKKFLNDKSKERSKAIIKDNLGFAYFKNGQDEKGFHLMSEGLKMRIETNDNYGSIESHLHLADYYSQKDLHKSDENALEAYAIASKLNSVDERLEALQILISNNNSGQNHKYTQQYFRINDSIIKVRNNFKNKFAKIKYDSKKEKDENEQLRLEKAENELSLQTAKYLRIVFAIVLFFLLILIAILIRYYKNKNKAIEFKSSYDTETRIAKKIHDELANDVFQVIAFAESQSLAKENTKENLLQKLDDIYGRVRGISKENNKIDIGIAFTQNIKEMLSAYHTGERNIIATNLESVNWETVDDIKKITIGRVLQELMVNMKKHSKANLVVIKFENDPKSIYINYTDNGIGCEKTKISKNGLQNMENRIQAVKGIIEFETEPNNGFKARIVIPK
ncbi:ATP-binding protein [Flavobacterium sp. 17A]|uniref:histidine kinase n=2 Tax=Flavobacterium potami TaxID=2872310 RepID=A0A9X1H740_9FLAO|nr:tetratricopeptide repeat-containing sensor histidine kinase [Flavobacterium potami]MBZ4033346.1 ATP-binding protein [Flavobacterium potami]